MPTDAEVEERRRETLDWYDEAVHRFLRTEAFFARRVERALREAFLENAKVESRTKKPASVAGKACRVVDGRFKYDQPRTQITDYVGLRILLPLTTDIAPVSRLLDELFVVTELTDERSGSVPEVPGYQSRHLLVRLREQDRDDVDFQGLGDPVVEIQVRTILQHAWASLTHDVQYKSERELPASVQRRLTALAGLLELAEREFLAVRRIQGSDAETPAPAQAAPHWLDEALARLFPDESAEPAWTTALAEVCDQLGIRDNDALAAELGPVGAAPGEWLRGVRKTRPWASPAYAVDLLLRETLGDDYRRRREAAGE